MIVSPHPSVIRISHTSLIMISRNVKHYLCVCVCVSPHQGSLTLPSRDAMWRDVRRKQDELRRQYVRSQRHTIMVDFVPFMDELAELVGCKPSIGQCLAVPRILTGCFFVFVLPSVHVCWLRSRKFSRRSCQNSNLQPFDHESGALTNKLSRLPTVLYSSTNTVTLFQSVLMVRSLFPLVKATQFYCSATLFHTQCRRHRSTRCTEFYQYSDAISVDHWSVSPLCKVLRNFFATVMLISHRMQTG